MAKKKKEKVLVQEVQEVQEVKAIQEEVQEEVKVDNTQILISLATQEFLNTNREVLFKEIPSLITAEFYEDPPRVMLVVSAKLDNLPAKEFNGLNIVFDQMVLGGVVIQRDSSIAHAKTFSNDVKEVVDLNQNVFGKDCVGPHNPTAKSTQAVEAWKNRHKNVKVVE